MIRTVFFCAFLRFFAVSALADNPVDIPDENLKAAIEAELGISNPNATDMLELTELSAAEKDIVDLTGIEYATNLQELYLDGNIISDISALSVLTNLQNLGLNNNLISDISAIAGLTNLQRLGLENNQINNISVLTGLINLQWLFLQGNNFSDISALASLTNLQRLGLENNQVDDISVLTGLTNLNWLNLQGNIINDISALAELKNLQTLYLKVNQISDISPLAGLIDLHKLDLNVNDISDISAITGLTNLQQLFLKDNLISDISALTGLTNLQMLSLKGNLISDISALSDMTNMSQLELIDNQISDISPLEGLTNLQRLYMGDNQISNISSLEDLTNLKELGLGGNRISDISPLAGLTELTWLDIGDNQLNGDINLLTNLINLEALYLHNSAISDISPLVSMTKLSILHLNGNEIQDISMLPNLTNLTELFLDKNQIIDISPLARMTDIVTLSLHYNLVSDISPLSEFTNLVFLDLTENNLSLRSYDYYIPIIETNNPNAEIYCDPKPELIAYYPMNEGLGPFVEDVTGNGHDGFINEEAKWVQSMPGFGTALDFTNGSYVDTGTWYPSRDGEPFSVLAWINVLDSWSASNGGWQGIVTQTTGQGVGNSVFQLTLQNVRGLGVGGGTIPQCFYSFPPEGQWTHVAFSFDGEQATVYMNGKEIGTTNNYVVKTLDNANVRIGTSIINSSSWICPFNGIIDEVYIFNDALSQTDIQKVMEGEYTSVKGEASSPCPEDEAIDVPLDVVLSWAPGEETFKHHVFFGTNFNDVDNGTAYCGEYPLEVNYFNPGILEYGQTYYWRIDEENVPSDPGTHIGHVWQFTVEPIGYPLPSENIISVTASSYFENSDPNNTINNSGLDIDDMHSAAIEDMWLGQGSNPGESWIQYEFNDVIKLHQMLVWNFNADLLYYFGFKDVNVEYSIDGQQWEALADVPQFAIAPGDDGYESNTTVDFNGAYAKYVKLTALSNWGIVIYNQYGLSEVRFSYIPIRAREPNPVTEEDDVPISVTLSWKPGREADEHKVFLSLEEQAVINGTSFLDTTSQANYCPLPLELSRTYFWRVDEVNDNENNTTWQGDIWSFSTQEYLVVDDFENYSNEEPGRICDIWTDGRDDPANGSIIGHNDNYQILETDIVHGDSYSAPIFYDNSDSTYSEVTVKTYDLAIGTDWTKGAPETLVLWFQGDPGNSIIDKMYVKINGVKIDYDGNPDDISKSIWRNWNIDLVSSGIGDLSNVTDFAIGIERTGEVGGSGVIFIDDISLYRVAPPAPADEIWIEAELPYSLSSPMMTYEDSDASGGFYISVEPGYNSTDEPPAPYGVATYSITVNRGTYKISVRVIAPSTDDDSFWVDISGATTNTLNHNSGWVKWNNIEPGSQWHWDDVHSSDDGDQIVEFFLEAGTHTMRIAYREDGALLDAILITKID